MCFVLEKSRRPYSVPVSPVQKRYSPAEMNQVVREAYETVERFYKSRNLRAYKGKNIKLSKFFKIVEKSTSPIFEWGQDSELFWKKPLKNGINVFQI